MPASPAVSIITPTFNRCIALPRAIASVKAQTFGDYEHIIIDDSSTDETISAVREFQDPRITLISLPEWKGANFARNVGIAAAQAPLLTFLDSDDEFLPGRLLETVRFFEKYPDRHLLISSFETHKLDRVFPCVNPSGYLPPRRWEEALVAHAVFIAGSAVTVRRKLINDVGGFNPTLKRMQDRDLLLRLARLEGASLRSEIDWIKHRSIDSISAPREDYLIALSALFETHRETASSSRTLIGYLVARTLLSDLMRGDLNSFRQGLTDNARLQTFRFSILDLVRNYRSGKSIRKRITAALRSSDEYEGVF